MKIYTIHDIDCVQALENGSMMIFFKDGTKVKTTDISFNDDTTIEFGYIYS